MNCICLMSLKILTGFSLIQAWSTIMTAAGGTGQVQDINDGPSTTVICTIVKSNNFASNLLIQSKCTWVPISLNNYYSIPNSISSLWRLHYFVYNLFMLLMLNFLYKIDSPHHLIISLSHPGSSLPLLPPFFCQLPLSSTALRKLLTPNDPGTSVPPAILGSFPT